MLFSFTFLLNVTKINGCFLSPRARFLFNTFIKLFRKFYRFFIIWFVVWKRIVSRIAKPPASEI